MKPGYKGALAGLIISLGSLNTLNCYLSNQNNQGFERPPQGIQTTTEKAELTSLVGIPDKYAQSFEKMYHAKARENIESLFSGTGYGDHTVSFNGKDYPLYFDRSNDYMPSKATIEEHLSIATESALKQSLNAVIQEMKKDNYDPIVIGQLEHTHVNAYASLTGNLATLYGAIAEAVRTRNKDETGINFTQIGEICKRSGLPGFSIIGYADDSTAIFEFSSGATRWSFAGRF